MDKRTNQPIEVEAYVCKKCHALIVGPLEYAQKHAKIPIKKAFPEGLVLKAKTENCTHFYVLFDSDKIHGDGTLEKAEHGTEQDYAFFQQFPGGNLQYFNAFNTWNSRQIPEYIKDKSMSLLSPAEFEKFKRDFKKYRGKSDFLGKIEFLRTTPELEALVRSQD
jgi:hypothetical protein